METILHGHELVSHIKQSMREGINPSLELMTALNEELGSPDTSFASIQITGTNGKSSTSYLLACMLASEGFRVGRFTSPELIRSNERIALSSEAGVFEDISSEELHACMVEVYAAAERLSVRMGQTYRPSEFELITAIALFAFKRAGVDFAVLEVGMGGKWDSTSVVSPSVSVITSIGLDHAEFLGNTLEEIAADKAHIIKRGSAPILGDGFDEQLPIFLNRAQDLENHARLVRSSELGAYGDEELAIRYKLKSESYEPNSARNTLFRSRFAVTTPHAVYENLEIFAPAFQVRNAALAIAAAESALGRALKEEALQSALADFFIPARFEPLSFEPLSIFDGSHNPQAAQFLAEILEKTGQRYLIAMGAFKDKDVAAMLDALAPYAKAWIAIQPDETRYASRLLPAAEMAALISQHNDKDILACLVSFELETLQAFASEHKLPLLICGSLSMYHLIKSKQA